MSELLLAVLPALPGIAALGAGAARWRTWRAAGRVPLPVRLGLLLLVALAIGACHSTHRGAFAQGPVPLAKVPFSEPLRYSVGTRAGEVVETASGLLASYFAGAAYERLDHQQIDATVDFTWDAIAAPPVISPDAFDTDEGCGGFCNLPPRWGIWSVAWEGYLETPAGGTYGLGIHVNNGGWLEMKNAAAALEVVVAAPGGPGFEGTVTATRTLAAGRHYLRFSFFQNGPPIGVAQLLWRPPGAADLAVIPSASLFTQVEDRVKRAFLFVHGIKGDFNARPFRALMSRIESRYPHPEQPGQSLVEYFRYHQDLGSPGCRERSLDVVLPFNDQVGYPVNFPVVGEPQRCDSNDDVGVNGLFLEADIRRLHGESARFGVQKITLISNSMGAAIVRAYLAYASATRSDPGKLDTLAMVDAVVFLHGVQQGAFGAAAREFFDERPHLQPIRERLSTTVRELSGIDPERPAIIDLAPGSEMIRYVNQLDRVPADLHYLNVRSDIRLRPAVLLLGYRYPFAVGVGDYLILPGDQNPTRTPDGGGAGFLPSVVTLGRSSGQWTLGSAQTVFFEIAPLQLPVLVATQPESHFALGDKLGEPCVQTPAGRKRLDLALFDAIVALDSPRPDLALLNFGNLGSVPCN